MQFIKQSFTTLAMSLILLAAVVGSTISGFVLKSDNDTIRNYGEDFREVTRAIDSGSTIEEAVTTAEVEPVVSWTYTEHPEDRFCLKFEAEGQPTLAKAEHNGKRVECPASAPTRIVKGKGTKIEEDSSR